MVRVDKRGGILIPIGVALVFTLAGMFPVLHIMVMYSDGGLMALMNYFFRHVKSFELSPVRLSWIVNLPLSTAFLFLFFRSRHTWSDLTWSILSVIFLFCLIIFSMDKGLWEIIPYGLIFMLASLGAGAILCLVAFMKHGIIKGSGPGG